MSRIISFRGKLSDGEVETIALQTNNGLTGYKVTKFQVFPENPGTLEYEGVVKIFKTDQAGAIVGTVNFSDNRLLGVGYYASSNSKAHSPLISVFDNEVFNQDIFITYKANTGSASMNYYIELEQIKLDLNEQTVATLKDIRNNNVQS